MAFVLSAQSGAVQTRGSFFIIIISLKRGERRLLSFYLRHIQRHDPNPQRLHTLHSNKSLSFCQSDNRALFCLRCPRQQASGFLFIDAFVALGCLFGVKNAINKAWKSAADKAFVFGTHRKIAGKVINLGLLGVCHFAGTVFNQRFAADYFEKSLAEARNFTQLHIKRRLKAIHSCRCKKNKLFNLARIKAAKSCCYRASHWCADKIKLFIARSLSLSSNVSTFPISLSSSFFSTGSAPWIFYNSITFR